MLLKSDKFGERWLEVERIHHYNWETELGETALLVAAPHGALRWALSSLGSIVPFLLSLSPSGSGAASGSALSSIRARLFLGVGVAVDAGQWSGQCWALPALTLQDGLPGEMLPRGMGQAVKPCHGPGGLLVLSACLH